MVVIASYLFLLNSFLLIRFKTPFYAERLNFTIITYEKAGITKYAHCMRSFSSLTVVFGMEKCLFIIVVPLLKDTAISSSVSPLSRDNYPFNSRLQASLILASTLRFMKRPQGQFEHSTSLGGCQGHATNKIYET